MTHGSLFSGIGGFDLAAEWMGWENKFHCEWNEFGQKILKHYWPNAESFYDITKTNFTKYANTIDILTGGFPCQPYSLAGKRKGKDDERHLWPEMLRAIREIRPRWVVGENVFGLINWSGGLVFHEVQADLEAEGYEVQPYVLPACSVNAPHRRDRVWFVANSNNTGNTALRSGTDENGQAQGIQRKRPQFEFSGSRNARNASNSMCQGLQRRQEVDKWGKYNCERKSNGVEFRTNCENNDKYSRKYFKDFPTQSPICTRNDGLPTELDGITFSKWRNESIKAAGNAIVPQVVYQIFKAIEQYDKLNK